MSKSKTSKNCAQLRRSNKFIKDRKSLIPHPSSLIPIPILLFPSALSAIPYTSSHIPYPSSLISYPLSPICYPFVLALIPYPLRLIPQSHTKFKSVMNQCLSPAMKIKIFELLTQLKISQEVESIIFLTLLLGPNLGQI